MVCGLMNWRRCLFEATQDDDMGTILKDIELTKNPKLFTLVFLFGYPDGSANSSHIDRIPLYIRRDSHFTDVTREILKFIQTVVEGMK